MRLFAKHILFLTSIAVLVPLFDVATPVAFSQIRQSTTTFRAETVEEMLTHPRFQRVEDGDQCTTARYSTSHTVGDGSGNTYVYDADSTATADDVKILPGIGGAIGGSDGTGRWLLMDNGWVNSSASGSAAVNLSWDNAIRLTDDSTLSFLGNAGRLQLTSNRSTVLNGTSQYWTRTGSPVSAYPFSYSAWAKLDADAASNGTVMSLTSSVSGVIYMGIRFDTNGGVTLLRRGGATTTTTIPASITPGTEHHVAVVWASATEVEIFIDGVSIYSTPLTSLTFPAVDRFLIGQLRLSPADGYFDGTIRDVRVFDVAIDSTEIAKIIAREFTTNTPVGWWRMDIDGTDYGSGGVDVAATGSPTFTAGASITWPSNTVWHGRQSSSVYDWYGDLFDIAMIGGVPHVTPLRDNPEFVYASDYGIKAGGSFATPLNSLLTANPTATVVLPPGIIDIASTIDLADFSGRIIAPNTILNWTGGASPMLTSSGANWIIDGLRLDGNDTATIGFQLEGSSGSGNAGFPRITITNCTTAIDCGGVGTNVNAADLNFGKCDIRDCTNGLKVNHSQGVNYVFQSAYFWNVDNGFLFEGGGGLHADYVHCVNIGNILSITGGAADIGSQNGHYAIMGGKVDGQQLTTPTIVHCDTAAQCRVNVSNFRIDGLQKSDGRFLFDLTSSGQVSVYVRDSGIFDADAAAPDIASLNADTGKYVKLVLENCQFKNTGSFDITNNITAVGAGAKYGNKGGEDAATLAELSDTGSL